MTRKTHSVSNLKKGFALIVTLSLMILLTVIAVGLLSLSSITLRTSSQGNDMSTARSNARLALMIAIGELQRNMGPDRRISVPGSQKLQITDKKASKNWTGVYDSWIQDSTLPLRQTPARPTPTFRRWLISGDDSIVSAENSATTNPALATKTVALTAASTTADAIKAGLVDAPNGAFAWWVADQNTKAKISDASVEAVDEREALARLQATPRFNHGLFLSGVSESDPKITNIVSVATSKFLNGDPEEMLHEVTTDSNGLFTNVRHGGLRKDLSFLLEQPWSAAKTSADLPALYEASNGMGGINLRELWLYYNIWGEYKSGPPQHADGASFDGSAKYLQQPVNAGAARQDPFMIYKYATKIDVRYVFSLIAEESTGNGGQKSYKLFLTYDPVLVFWNPFNIPYHIPPSGFNGIKMIGFPYDLELEIGTFRLNKPVAQLIGNEAYVTMQVAKDSKEKFVMRPGEVQVIAQGGNSTLKDPGINQTQNAYLGWQNGGGYKRQIKLTKPDGTEYLPNTTDIIRYALKPSSSRVTVAALNSGGGNTNSTLNHIAHHIGAGNGNMSDSVVRIGTIGIGQNKSGVSETLASEIPHVFPEIPMSNLHTNTVGNIAISAGSNNGSKKWQIAILSLSARTEADSEFTGDSISDTRFVSRPFLRFNPKIRNPSMGQGDKPLLGASPYQYGIKRAGGGGGSPVNVTGSGQGFFGGDLTASQGTPYVVTHSLPFAPIISLGAFQNSVSNGSTQFEAPPLSGGPATVSMVNPSISYAIGNSFAPSVLSSRDLRGELNSANGPLQVVDHSYLANMGLWDDYFFSSIAPVTTTSQSNATQALVEQKEAFKAFAKAEIGGAKKLLPNPRMRSLVSDYDAAEAALFPGSITPGEEPYRLSASYLTVDGAFNVNSTSQKAWQAFLMGLKNSEVPTFDPLSPKYPPTLVKESDTPVAGLIGATGEKIEESKIADPKNPEQWLGFRSLTDSQIEELAAAICEQVRDYGPFLSIADFVNRRPDGSSNQSLKGPLQAAIDATSINAEFNNRSASGSSTDFFANSAAEDGPKSAGIPGYVKQGDLLTTMGPLLAVRGDTFLIRAYGEARSTGGKVTARVWCEATVQRDPDFLDSADMNHLAFSNLTSETNKQLGRKFRIISFRYLNPSEIL